MTQYRYEVHEVTALAYDVIKLGSEFQGGTVIGIGGMEGDCLIVTAHRRITDAKVVLKLPKGWSVYFFGGLAVAIHPKHSPRILALHDIESTTFENWPEMGSEQ